MYQNLYRYFYIIKYYLKKKKDQNAVGKYLTIQVNQSYFNSCQSNYIFNSKQSLILKFIFPLVTQIASITNQCSAIEIEIDKELHRQTGKLLAIFKYLKKLSVSHFIKSFATHYFICKLAHFKNLFQHTLIYCRSKIRKRLFPYLISALL